MNTIVIIKISLIFTLILFILGFLLPLILIKRAGKDPHGTHHGSKILTRLSSISIFAWLLYLLLFIFLPLNIVLFDLLEIMNISFFLIIIGITLTLVGFLFELLGILTLGLNFRIELPKEETELITSGIYSIMRNPILFGMFLLFIGSFLMIPDIFLLIITICNFITFNSKALDEEKFLLTRFGEQYQVYKNRVGMYFPIPLRRIFKFKKS